MILVLKDDAPAGIWGAARYRPEFSNVTGNWGLFPSCSAYHQTLSIDIRFHLS